MIKSWVFATQERKELLVTGTMHQQGLSYMTIPRVIHKPSPARALLCPLCMFAQTKLLMFAQER